MRWIASATSLFTLLIQSIGYHNTAPGAAPLNFCQLRPAFMEDFQHFLINSWSLDGANWIAHTPWHGDFGDAAFTDPGPDGPFSVVDGALNITARKGKDGRWRSGLIAAADGTGRGHGVRYGYFEARMKLPPGPGTWPAFWLAQLKSPTDTSPSAEIDVIEYYGQFDGGYHATLHEWYGNPSQTWFRAKVVEVPAGSLVTGWHDYGVRILPDRITFFLDRRPVWDQPTPPELKEPMYPLVDLALGSGWPITNTPNPSVLKVRYIHVYQYVQGGTCDKTSKKTGF